MKKRILSLALALALSFALAGQTLAVSLPPVLVNGEVLTMETPAMVWESTTYVDCRPIVQAFYPDAEITQEGDRVQVRSETLNIDLKPGRGYVIANGRYLPVAGEIKSENGVTMVPVRLLGRILGLNVEWDAQVGAVLLTESGTGPIQSGESYYNPDDLYWLSHIIFAESGNQPLEGQIAVGNVILNRVASPLFPETIYKVIHQTNQFSPVRSGTINLEPRELSVIAAKLALEGANTAGNSLYFINPRVSGNSWVARTRTHVTTIAAHAFYR